MSESLYQTPQPFEKLTPEPLTIATTFTDSIVDQLIDKSHQPHIVAATPGDSAERFRSQADIEQWHQAGKRVVYSLLNPDGDLGGIAWYRPGELEGLPYRAPAPNHTFGIRTYEGYAGRGLALPFMSATFADYIQNPDNGVDVKTYAGLWLKTGSNTERALHLYERFGFEPIAKILADFWYEPTAEELAGRRIMVLPRKANLQAMLLWQAAASEQ